MVTTHPVPLAVYIAAALPLAESALRLASVLAKAGYRVTSTWYLDPVSVAWEESLDEDALSMVANECLAGVEQSDVVVVIVSPLSKGRAGHVAEAFQALGAGKEVLVVFDKDEEVKGADLPTILFLTDKTPRLTHARLHEVLAHAQGRKIAKLSWHPRGGQL